MEALIKIEALIDLLFKYITSEEKICKDIHIVYRTEVKDMQQLGVASDHLQKMVQEFLA